MIEAQFEFPSSARRRVLEAFLSLPPPLSPTHFAENEGEVGTLIDDQNEFLKFADARETGFALQNSQIFYDLSFAGWKPIICNCFFEVNNSSVEQFTLHMAEAQPLFGFACDSEERERKNRLTAILGINTIESWVGRDIEKYIPGLYWITVLPNALAERHHIPLSALEKIAVEHVELEGGQHVFRFYERPEDWSSATNVVKLASTLPNVFNIEVARPQFSRAKTFLEFQEIARNWD